VFLLCPGLPPSHYAIHVRGAMDTSRRSLKPSKRVHGRLRPPAATAMPTSSPMTTAPLTAMVRVVADCSKPLRHAPSVPSGGIV
jgi:hypothetical protein